MRRWRLVLTAAMVAAVPAVAVAQGADVDSVTGGGEVTLDPLQPAGIAEGPGDTIAFTAQQAPDSGAEFGALAAIGEVELVDRQETDGQQGRNQSIVHGDVVCLEVAGRKAVIGYRTSSRGQTFPQIRQLTVYDNEEPADDVIVDDIDPALPCSVETPPDGVLARGEARIHDAE